MDAPECLCQVRGPRCTELATTAHHKLPSSQHPEAFWHPSNLQAAGGPCNHHGANVKHENRINRSEIAYLESVIEELEAERDELADRLAEYEGGSRVAVRSRTPQIY